MEDKLTLGWHDLDELETELERYRSDIRKIVASLEARVKEAEAMNDRLSSHLERVEDLSRRTGTLLQELEAWLAQTDNKINPLREQIAEVRKEVEDWAKSIYNSLQEYAHQEEARRSKITDEITRVQSEVEKLSNSLSDLRLAVDHLKTQPAAFAGGKMPDLLPAEASNKTLKEAPYYTPQSDAWFYWLNLPIAGLIALFYSPVIAGVYLLGVFLTRALISGSYSRFQRSVLDRLTVLEETVDEHEAKLENVEGHLKDLLASTQKFEQDDKTPSKRNHSKKPRPFFHRFFRFGKSGD